MVQNTIFGALLDDRLVDWGLVLHKIIGKLVENVRKGKATPIYPYLFHMYKEQYVLLHGEIVTYNLGLELVKYNCTPDPEPAPDTSKSEQGLNLEPIVTSMEK